MAVVLSNVDSYPKTNSLNADVFKGNELFFFVAGHHFVG